MGWLVGAVRSPLILMLCGSSGVSASMIIASLPAGTVIDACHVDVLPTRWIEFHSWPQSFCQNLVKLFVAGCAQHECHLRFLEWIDLAFHSMGSGAGRRSLDSG